MPAFLLARTTDGVDEYWTGESGEQGFPIRAAHKCDAFHFKTPRQAYDAAQAHRWLRDSNQWRVVPR